MDVLDDLPAILTFPFKDEKWRAKLLVGFLLALGTPLIVPQWLVLGYLYELSRSMISAGGLPSLPEWRNLGGLFKNGLRVFCAAMVYTLPPLVLMDLPLAVIAVVAWGQFSQPLNENFKIIAYILGMMGVALGILLFIFSIAIMGVAATHMIAKDELRAAFRPKEWWPIFKDNFAIFILYVFLVMAFFWSVTVVSLALSLTVILIITVPLILAFAYLYVTIVGSVLFSHAYREGIEKLTG